MGKLFKTILIFLRNTSCFEQDEYMFFIQHSVFRLRLNHKLSGRIAHLIVEKWR